MQYAKHITCRELNPNNASTCDEAYNIKLHVTTYSAQDMTAVQNDDTLTIQVPAVPCTATHGTRSIIEVLMANKPEKIHLTMSIFLSWTRAQKKKREKVARGGDVSCTKLELKFPAKSPVINWLYGP